MSQEPAFTASLSAPPTLNAGDVDADIETASPVLRQRLIRAGLLLVPNVPNPSIRTPSPSARGSPMAASTPSTASLANRITQAGAGRQPIGHLGYVHPFSSPLPVLFRLPVRA